MFSCFLSYFDSSQTEKDNPASIFSKTDKTVSFHAYLACSIKSPLFQLCKKTLKRSFHFLGESTELRYEESVVLPLHRFVQTLGREGFPSKNIEIYALRAYILPVDGEHRPLKNRVFCRSSGSARDQNFRVSKHRRSTSTGTLDLAS